MLRETVLLQKPPSNNMNTNKPTVPNTTVTRNVNDLDQKTHNIYESLVIISKRANQISNNMKEELHGKLAEFASSNDNLEEIFENREQIEISKYYERLPKPSLIAIDEFLNDKIYYRNPAKEQQ
jgi:DNA-directed RNA polymerase subunit K/omega